MNEKFRLWFFRDLNDDQRLKLFGLFGVPVNEVGPNHGRQSIALQDVMHNLVETDRSAAISAAPTRRDVMTDNTEEIREIDEAEACIRSDYRAGIISKHQFQKEMLIMERARNKADRATPEGQNNG